MSTPVDIVLSVFNGARYLVEQIDSIRRQTHGGWRLWIRDDGSDDGSWDVARAAADADTRIHVHPRDNRCLGSGPAFGWLMERLPTDSRYVFCSDADDVWLPRKIERSLQAMAAAEASATGPVLVHTDLVVADGDLKPLAPSLWRHLRLVVDSAWLPRIAVANVVTGPTILLNRALLDEVVPIPREAVHQDWWIALVAAAVGRIVPIPEATALYRRHGANHTGFLEIDSRPVARFLRRLRSAPGRTRRLRATLDAGARQAGAFLARFGPRIDPAQRQALEQIEGIASCGMVERKRRLWHYHVLPERGFVRNLGLLVRG